MGPLTTEMTSYFSRRHALYKKYGQHSKRSQKKLKTQELKTDCPK